MLAAPLPADLDRFGQRFGIAEFTTAYGTTEMPAALNHDLPVPPGAAGEAIVRTDLPWMLSPGYVNNPGATASAWRNGWFHTGDLLRRDENGAYFYLDRKKDALRRRGENVSTYEVEQEVAAHPAVVDDEVKVFIVPKPGQTLDFPELLRFCSARMPHFMVPRYFELVDELAKTASARVKKYELRRRGNTAGTWDAEAHGWKITRHGPTGRPEPSLCADPDQVGRETQTRRVRK